MVGTRDKTIVKKQLVKYMSSLGLKVNTVTKARGNKGFFREGRIDVSRNLDDASCVKTLIHEYAHYVNYCLDKKIKSLEAIFREDNKLIREELLRVTNYVDENALCHTLYNEREHLKKVIKSLTESVRVFYPKFKPNEELKEFKKYSRWSNLSYLEKYDRVRIHSWFSFKLYSIANVRKDFPNIPEVFVDYLKLKSNQRKRAKISRRISKLNKYYNELCELFARFVEGLYLDSEVVRDMAPYTYNKFVELYNQSYYVGLKEVFSIVGVDLEK